MLRGNPNGANQSLPDPRQKLMWSLYVNPTSETFSNATQSAIKAGYTETTANQITTEAWFIGKLGTLNLLDDAVAVLKEMLVMPVLVEETVGYGDDAELVVKTSPALVKIKQDTAKFVSERQGKEDGWASRSELTGKNGERLVGLSALFDAAAKPENPTS